MMKIAREIEPQNFKSNILSFLQTMRKSNDPVTHYRLFSKAEPTPFASAFAIFIKYLFGDIITMTQSEKNEWIKYFKSFQNEQNGLFCDPSARKRVVDERHDVVHLDMQLTTFCISALECLDSQADYPIKFLYEFKDQNYMQKWLDSLDWNNAWNSGNKVMFIAICLIYNFEKFDDIQARESLDVWFNWMNNNQDPETGFWGKTKSTKYFNGMGGFYHQFVIYNYLKNEVNYPDKVVDRLLFLQQADGGFNPEMGGGACDDIDGIDPLVHFYHKYDYRRDDIKLALKKALRMIIKNQNNDFGFCWSKHYWYDFRHHHRLITNFLICRDQYYTSLCTRGLLRGQKKDFIKQSIKTGWSNIHRLEKESSLFDTWLRCTTIGEITSIIKDVPISKVKMNFLPAPGLGWFDPPVNNLI